MSYTPSLKRQTPPLAAIAYECIYRDEYIDPISSDLDPIHIHDFWELFISFKGDVSFLVDNHLYPANVGDVILSRPNQLHVCDFPKADDYAHVCLWLENSETVHEKLSSLPTRIPFRAQALQGLTESLNVLQKECPSWQSLTALLKIFDLLQAQGNEKTDDLRIPPALQAVLDYVDQNVGEIESVAHLCNAFYLSRSTLNRLFSQHLKLSPKQYLTSRKLALSKTLLLEGLSVEDVAQACSFPDSSRFIAVFKERFGITPLAFAKQAQSG